MKYFLIRWVALMNEIKTVFFFTLKSTLRKKAFRISTVIILAVILILCALPALFSSDADDDTGTETAGYNCYYIDEKGLIHGGAEILASSFPVPTSFPEISPICLIIKTNVTAITPRSLYI